MRISDQDNLGKELKKSVISKIIESLNDLEMHLVMSTSSNEVRIKFRDKSKSGEQPK